METVIYMVSCSNLNFIWTCTSQSIRMALMFPVTSRPRRYFGLTACSSCNRNGDFQKQDSMWHFWLEILVTRLALEHLESLIVLNLINHVVTTKGMQTLSMTVGQVFHIGRSYVQLTITPYWPTLCTHLLPTIPKDTLLSSSIFLPKALNPESELYELEKNSSSSQISSNPWATILLPRGLNPQNTMHKESEWSRTSTYIC